MPSVPEKWRQPGIFFRPKADPQSCAIYFGDQERSDYLDEHPDEADLLNEEWPSDIVSNGDFDTPEEAEWIAWALNRALQEERSGR